MQTTIIATCDVSQDFIRQSFKEAQSISRIDTVTVQDLLLSSHRPLFAQAKYISTSTPSQLWKFVDKMDVSEFTTWQERRNLMITRSPAPQPGLHAEVRIPVGTPLVQILGFLEDLQKDTYVNDVSFSGALIGYHKTMVPQELCDLVDYKSQRLEDDIILSVSCGRRRQAWADDLEWKDLLQECCLMLHSLVLLSLKLGIVDGILGTIEEEKEEEDLTGVVDYAAKDRAPIVPRQQRYGYNGAFTAKSMKLISILGEAQDILADDDFDHVVAAF